MTTVLITDERIPATDGTLLATEVFRPAEGGPWPTLLVRTPYGRKSIRQGLDPTDLVRSGWVVAIQDVRARWDSGGTYKPWIFDADDGADTIAWCRAQPWSNGEVVMQGASYDGITAWIAASHLPRGLAAISTVVSSPTIFDPLITRGGLFNYGFILHWCLGHAAYGSPTTPPNNASDAARQLGRWTELIHEPEALQTLGELYPPVKEWLRRHEDLTRGHRPGEEGQIKEERSSEWVPVTTPAAGGQATPLMIRGLPVYQITGWFDCFVEGAIAGYQVMSTTPAPQRLVIGPWSHGKVFSSECGDVDSGPAASGWERFPGEQLEFLTSAAQGGDLNGGVSVWVLGADTWADMPTWPPPSQEVTLHLGGVTPRSWEHLPEEPVPTRGGRTLLPEFYFPAGPCLRTDYGRRSDLLRLSSDPLIEPLTIMGAPRLSGVLTTTTERTELFAVLGVERAGEVTGILDAGAPLNGAGTHRFDLDLGNIALHVREGERLVIDLASSNFPAHRATPETGRRTLAAGVELTLPITTSTSRTDPRDPRD